MASGDTRTQQYLGIAANGNRADLPAETCCETRTQTLTREVAERVIRLDEEVQEIKNNPDVVDIVDTYADLQAYDKTKLTDKDVIRVLADETHDGDSTYYRYDKNTNAFTYIGESKQYTDFVGTDGQTAGAAGLVPAPATTDANKFLKSDGTWAEAGGGGGGDGARVLSTADYNANHSNWSDTDPTHFDCVALWKMPVGVYVVPSGVNAYANTDPWVVGEGIYIVGATGTFGMIIMEVVRSYTSAGDSAIHCYNTNASTGSSMGSFDLAKAEDRLTSSHTVNPLSAKQGKVLNEKITAQGNTLSASAPTTSTVGVLGQLWTDTTNMHTYQCTAISGNTYTWTQRW